MAYRKRGASRLWSRHVLTNPTRYYLEVPYEDRENAKALGARWDIKRRLWYVRDLATYEQCRRWKPIEIYLNVPFDEKEDAKARGAKFDTGKKKWRARCYDVATQCAQWMDDRARQQLRQIETELYRESTPITTPDDETAAAPCVPGPTPCEVCCAIGCTCRFSCCPVCENGIVDNCNPANSGYCINCAPAHKHE